MVHLLEKNCVKFARRLQWLLAEAAEKNELESFSVVRLLHSHGINVRYLGVVLGFLKSKTNDPLSTMTIAFVLCEILARALKNEINSLLRETMRKIRLPMEARYRSAVVRYLNTALIYDSEDTHNYWNQSLKPKLIKFYYVGDPYTSQEFDILKFIDESTFKGFGGRSRLLYRVADLASLIFSPIVGNKIQRLQRLEVWDLEGFREQIKHMNIIADTTGTINMLNGLQLQQKWDFGSALFYFQQAEEKFEVALQSHPTNPSLLEHMALSFASRIICNQILVTDSEKSVKLRYGDWPIMALPPDDNDVQKADSFFLRAMDVAPENAGLRFLYGSFLSLCSRNDRAEDQYLRSLRSRLDIVAATSYAKMLESTSNQQYAEILCLRLRGLIEIEKSGVIDKDKEVVLIN